MKLANRKEHKQTVSSGVTTSEENELHRDPNGDLTRRDPPSTPSPRRPGSALPYGGSLHSQLLAITVLTLLPLPCPMGIGLNRQEVKERYSWHLHFKNKGWKEAAASSCHHTFT